ncbi:C25 family cysteine peptidase [Desulfoluna sp.]|uniref:C25 family cysteine peptidase n=1 Tax=Desulfoluna sp. TaxID=2045199 RepID=UPI0026039AE9|nr:C25 family cysteine peptidase [Desulfoluna sp.]
MKNFSKSAFILLYFLFAFASIASAAPADGPLRFEPGDTLADIQDKIQHNGYSFTVEATPIFTMAPGEKSRFFSRRSPGASKALRRSISQGPLQDMQHLALPDVFDWRGVEGHSYIGPVRDQGNCGSCYAFGASASAEGAYNFVTNKFNNDVADFSEAFIAFCLTDHYTGFDGCDGSDYDYEELDGLVDFGIANETDHPYDLGNQACPDSYPTLTQFKSWHRISCGDIDAMKRAIMAFGVIDVSVLVTDAFQAYSSGVYEDQNTTCDDDPNGICYYAATNHVISLVGWDDTPPEGGGGCWILRNSWGDTWGENGYMRIRYNSAHAACEGTYLVYEGEGPSVRVSEATDTSDTQATLNAMVNPEGENTEVHVEYGTTIECLTDTATASSGSGTTFEDVSIVLPGLTPQTTYHYRVVASNARGSVYSTLNYVTTAGSAGAPDARTGNAVVSLDQTTITGWINPHGTATTSYVEYGPDTDYGASTKIEGSLDGTQDLAVSTVLTDLSPLTTYHYRLVAKYDNDITAYGLDGTFDSKAAANMPLSTTKPATDVSSSLAVLHGTVNPNNSETTVPVYYYFEFGLTEDYGSTTPEQFAGASLDDLEFNTTIAGLEPMTTYHFRAVARNSAGTRYGVDRMFTTLQSLFYEGFDHETQAPPGWTQEIVSGNTPWSYSISSINHPDDIEAIFCSRTEGDQARLITPKIDLAGVASPVLSVEYDSEDVGNIQVYYRENSEETWQTDDSFKLPSDLKACTIALPSDLDQIYLAFSGTAEPDDCIAIYNVTISMDSVTSGGPIVKTGVMSQVTPTTALCTGNVISDNGSPITSRGVCWSPAAIPTTSDKHTVETGQAGSFSSLITGLSATTEYYARAYATHGDQTTYGETNTFKTENLSPPTDLKATSVTANQFTASWLPVDGATGYYIDVWESGAPLTRRSRPNTKQSGSPVTRTEPGMTTVECSFVPGDVNFTEESGFMTVDLKDGVMPQDAPGTPWLPARYINLMIPSGAQVTGIDVSGEEVSLKTGARLYPVQPAQSPSLPASGFVEPDPAAYAAPGKTPETLAVLQGDATMRGQSFVSLRLNPVRYAPAAQELFLATRLVVTVHYQETRRQGLPAEPLFQDALNSMVVNPRTVLETPKRRGTDGVDYLIITSQELAGAFGALTQHRQDAGGLRCEIKILEEIDAEYTGLDKQDKIRHCIQEYVEQKGLLYVVLGGDDTVVPARICPVHVDSYNEDMPTDLYYAALDGDWDGNGNQIYGEEADHVDLAPDVLVGRIPVRTVAHVKAYVDKLTAFETDPQALSRSTMLLTGSKLNDVYSGEDRPTDLMTDGLLQFREPSDRTVSDAEMWVRRLYRDHIQPLHKPDTLGLLFDTLTSWDAQWPGDYDLSAATAKAIYNQGWTHLFCSTHGNQVAWGLEGATSAIFSGDIETLTGLTPFVYTTACLSNAFNNSDRDPCLSEAFIRNPKGGALTYIGSSNYGWFCQDSAPASDTFLSSYGDSMHYAIRYYTRLFETDFISSGETFALHKADLIALSLGGTVARWLQFGLNLMGDPAIMVGGRYVPGYYRLDVGDVTQVDITGLTSGSQYHYRVSAEGGNSPRNNSATLDVQTAGMELTLDSHLVSENQPVGTRVGNLFTSDPAGTHTFELVSGTGDEDNGFFAINGEALQTSAVFDFEARNHYTIRVRVNDGSTSSFEKSFLITVENVDEDTDDDGIPDSLEDLDGDGMVDPGETDPTRADSDGDGIQDGTETGLTAGAIGPDTDTAVFIPDSDPTTQTIPWKPDTDGDGWMDGEEDANANGQVDDGESSPHDPVRPVPTPPIIPETIPHDKAGISDNTRIPNNTCFAACIRDADGIDLRDGQSIVFHINDGQAPAYDRNLYDTNVVRIVRLTDDPEDRVKEVWVAYDRSEEDALDPTYAFDTTVNVTMEATDRRGGTMTPAVFAFNVETEQAHTYAAAAGPKVERLTSEDPALVGEYDAGVKALSAGLKGATIVYDSTGPVTPGFGPSEEIPQLNVEGVTAVNLPMNLRPPAVFNVPVKLIIPCGDRDASTLSVFLYDGQTWEQVCDRQGNVTPEGQGFVVPGSRMNHPTSIEIKVYHFSAVQAAWVEAEKEDSGGSGGCFIETLK